jgi:hypothetical protein
MHEALGSIPSTAKTKIYFKCHRGTGHLWLMPIILFEIRRIAVQDQSRQIVHESPSSN